MMNLTYEQVSSLLETSQNEIANNQKYRLLSQGYIQKIWDERINKKAYFCIFISVEELDNIDFGQLANNISIVNTYVAENNFIQINGSGQVLNQYYKNLNTEGIKNELCELSKGHIAFFMGEQGVDSYINGAAMSQLNIFYSREDRIKYLEKKDISKIDDVIKEYSNSYVSKQVNYMCFMADNATLRQMTNGNNYIKRNILKNKPEHYMRDQLQHYLTEHMPYTFTIEPELGQTKRELDIYFDVKGELYFIEIKWLGASINDKGTGLSSTYYDESRARQGVVQSLEYIEELTNTTEASLRCGYLAIFDARDDQKDIDFNAFEFVEDHLKGYLQLFKVLPIIHLVKRHAA